MIENRHSKDKLQNSYSSQRQCKTKMNTGQTCYYGTATLQDRKLIQDWYITDILQNYCNRTDTNQICYYKTEVKEHTLQFDWLTFMKNVTLFYVFTVMIKKPERRFSLPTLCDDDESMMLASNDVTAKRDKFRRFSSM